MLTNSLAGYKLSLGMLSDCLPGSSWHLSASYNMYEYLYVANVLVRSSHVSLPLVINCYFVWCQGEELELSSTEHPDDLSATAVEDDEIASENTGAKLADVEMEAATEPETSVASDISLPMLASSQSAEGHNTASDATVSACQPASEPEVDFSRLDLDAEQLVASLFGDDDSSVSFEHPPMDNKNGFVSADHEDAAKWFYQDPQGVIQGERVYTVI